jgi:endonuclease/exonuclease/phosphatase family metal-dependent hydrolase
VNVRRGLTQLMRRTMLQDLRDRLHGLSTDILFPQEVRGGHSRGQKADARRNGRVLEQVTPGLLFLHHE